MARIKTLLIILFLICLSVNAWGADYYVTQAGAGDTDGTSCANAISIATFNSSASGGNTYVVCSGETITTTIAPPTGSERSVITLISEYEYDATGTQHDVTVSVDPYGANLTSKEYITIDGLYFYDVNTHWIYMNNADHCIIQNCKFYIAEDYRGIRLQGGSSYNKFLSNEFPDAPDSGDANGTNPSEMIGVFYDSTSNYNVVEDNTFGGCQHAAIAPLSAKYWVLRGNTSTNIYHGQGFYGYGFLVENNKLYDAGINIDDLEYPDGVSQPHRQVGIQANYPNGIVRRNIFDNNGSSLYMSSSSSIVQADNMRIYNNTMNKSIRIIHLSNDDPYLTDNQILKNNSLSNVYAVEGESGDNGTAYLMSYRSGQASQGSGNKFYNNNFYDPVVDYFRFFNTYGTLAQIVAAFPTQFPDATNTKVDPKYTDADNRDFTLQSDSPLIDAGTWLTIITTATGSGTTFTVADALYFYDGWGIPGETGDVIKTENGQTGTISSINYGTNQITLTSSISWTKDEGVTLNYNGNAPDIGAEEYGGDDPPDYGIENPTPAHNSTGVGVTTDISWTNGDDVTDVDVYFDDVDCTTKVVDGVDQESYDTGTMANADVFYWKVVANPDGENITFPESGCYEFTTVGTPPDLPSSIFISGQAPSIYNANGSPLIYVAP